MHYLIDAYNLLFRALKKRGSLEKSRKALIEELNEAVSQLNLHVTLVFDGAEVHQDLPSRGHYDAIELVYTPKSITADEYISEEVFHAKSPTQLTVVSNDRELTTRCQRCRAKTMSVDAFLGFLAKKTAQKKKKSARSGVSFKESSAEFARLLKIFEERLGEDRSQ